MLRDETDLSRKQIFIGYVDHTEAHFARVIALAEAFEYGWERITNQEERFPDSGKIFSLDPMAIGHMGRVLLFTVRESDRYSPGRDRYITNEVDEPYEIRLEFRDLSRRDQRLAACEEGIKRVDQIAQQVILPLGDGKVTVLPFRPSSAKRWIIANDVDLARIPLYDEGDCLDTNIIIENQSYALPGRLPVRYTGHRNWEDDGDFLETILRTIKRNDDVNGDPTITVLSRNAITKLRSAYQRAELFANPNDNRAALERLNEFLEFLPAELKALKTIAGSLVHSKDIAKAVEAQITEVKLQAKAAAAVEARKEAEARIEKEFESLSNELAEMRNELAALEAQKSAAQQEIDRLVLVRENELSGLSADLMNLLDSAATSGRAASRIFDLLDLSGQKLPTIGWSSNLSPPWHGDKVPEGEEILLGQLPSKILAASKTVGLDRTALRRLDVVLRAGRVAAVGGDASDSLVETYASCICGGRIFNVVLDPSILGADDLWGRSANGATSLKEGWTSAMENPDIPHLIKLIGVSKASLAPWFEDFSMVFTRSRPTNLMVVAVVDASAKSEAVSGDRVPFVPANGSSGSAIAAIMNSQRPLPRTFVRGGLRSLMMSEKMTDVVAVLSSKQWFTHENAVDALAYLEASLLWENDTGKAAEIVQEILGQAAESSSNTTQSA